MFLHTLGYGEQGEHTQIGLARIFNDPVSGRLQDANILLQSPKSCPEEKGTFCFLLSKSKIVTEKA